MSDMEQPTTPPAQSTNSMVDDIVNRMVGDIQDFTSVYPTDLTDCEQSMYKWL